MVTVLMQSKGYRLWNEKTQNVVVRRDIVFNEMDFGQPHSEAQREPPFFEVGLHDDPVIQEQPEIPAPQDKSPPPQRSC